MSFTSKIYAHYQIISNNKWPYFRNTDFKGMPDIQEQPDQDGDGRDPAGIYFFLYNKPSSSSVYDEKRKYTWEGQLKPAAKVLDLGTVTWEQAWVWLKKSGIRNVDDFWDVFTECHAHTYSAGTDTIGSEEKNDLIKEIKAESNNIIWLWFRILRVKVNNSKRLAQFFIDLGYDAILDPDDYLYGDEPQLIVLKKSAITMRLK